MKKAFSKRFGKRVSYAPDSFPGLVDKATDEMLFKLDWGLVTEVCDKASHVMGKEELRLGVRAARKRIQDDQHKVVMFGLQVIDVVYYSPIIYQCLNILQYFDVIIFS